MKHTYITLYSCTHRKLETKAWYDTKDNNYFYVKDITNDEYVRIPWANPTQRDLKAFEIGYSFGKEKQIKFERETKEW